MNEQKRVDNVTPTIHHTKLKDNEWDSPNLIDLSSDGIND